MTSELRDYLTGVYTRALLNDRMEQELARARRRGSPVSLILLDMDHFKSINDAFGHSRGDQALAETAARIKSQVRSFDEVFRYGGDEFVVLLPQTDLKEAGRMAHRILQYVGGTPLAGDPPLTVSVSIGVAVFPRDASTSQELFEKADRRNYQSKLMGRARVTLSDGEDGTSPHAVSTFNRLIERDDALARLKELLEHASMNPRSLLQVTGQGGAGFTRFLEEAQNLFRLRRYATLWISGRPALKSRMYGALGEALHGWKEVPKHLTAETIAAFFEGKIRRGNLTGLVILLDDWTRLDEATGRVVQQLFEDERFAHLVCVYAGGVDAMPIFEGFRDASLVVNLGPLSEAGVRIWLRNNVHWELPDEIVRMIADVTGGFPARLIALSGWLASKKYSDFVAFNEEQTTRFRQECFGVLKQKENKSGNLPEPLSSFFGREDEIVLLKKALREKRLISITGVGGIGKTRLALQAAREMSDYFDGAFFLSFERALPSHLVADRIAQEMQISLDARRDPFEQLLTELSGRRLLLILDDFEEAGEEAPLPEQIIEHTDSVKILVTTAEPLNMPGEVTVKLAGFPVPDSPADVEVSSAVRLFLDRASRHAGFEPDPASISRICRLVDGIPLGIELASAWVSNFTCEQIAHEIEKSLSFLTSEERGGRDKSLVAIFDSVLALFSRTEAGILMGLGLFKGRFSRQAAMEITGASPFFLDALANKLLIQRGVRMRRYENNATFSQYLFEKLARDPESFGQVTERYSRYYLGLLHEAGSAVRRSKEILADVDNIRHAWRLMSDAGKFDALAPALAEWMVYLRNRGWFREALELLKTLDLRTSNNGPKDLDARRFNLHVKSRLGEFHYHLGQYEDGVAILEDGLRLLQGQPVSGFEREEADLCRLMANNYGAGGKYREARELYRQARSIAESLNDLDLMYKLTNSLGVLEYLSADYKQAIFFAEQALALARQLDDDGKMVQALNNLGNMFFELGEYSSAKQFQNQALAYLPQIESTTLKGSLLDTMGKILTAGGEYPPACRAFWQGLTLIREIEATPLAVEMLVGVSELWNAMGESPLALSLAQSLVEHPAASHDVRCRAARLQDDLVRRSVEPAGRGWHSAQIRCVIEDVSRILEEQTIPQ